MKKGRRLLILLALLCRVTEAAVENNEIRLYKELFDNYEKYNRPVLNQSEAVKVVFDFQLIRVIDVSEKDQYIKTYAWVNQYWQNPQLKWDPKKYGGIEEIHVSPSDIWVPDILLYNKYARKCLNIHYTVDDEDWFAGGRHSYKINVAMKYDGNSTWLNPGMFKSICKVDVTYFPFDEQECFLKFGSWSFDSSKLDVYTHDGEMFNKNYVKNGEWKLTLLESQRNKLMYQCCPHAFVDVTVHIKLQRESLDFILKLIIPCSLISSMIFLGFVLPPESGERIGLSITVLLAMTVFQQLSSELMPSYGFPLLGQYYFACMIEIGISLVVTTLILNFYHRNSRRMPKALRILILHWLARIVFPQKSSKEWNQELPTSEPTNASFRRSSNQGEDQQALGSEDMTLVGDSLSEHSMRDPRSSSYSDPWIPMRSLSYDFALPANGISYNNNIRCQSCYLENGNRSQHTDCKRKKKFYNRNNKTKRKSSTRCKCPPGRSSIVSNQRASTISTSVVVDLLPENADISQEKLQNQKEWIEAARVLDRLFLIVSIVIGITTLFALFLKAPRFH